MPACASGRPYSWGNNTVFYHSPEQLQDVAQALIDRMAQDPQSADSLSSSGMLIRINVREPNLIILLDGRHNPASVTFGLGSEKPDLEIGLKSDTLHKVWLGQLRVRDAYFGGKISTKGNVFSAMKLADIFREAERLYPVILREKGYPV